MKEFSGQLHNNWRVCSMLIPDGADVIGMTATFSEQGAQLKNPKISEKTDLYNTYARRWVYFLIVGLTEQVLKQSTKLLLTNDIIACALACVRWGYVLPRRSTLTFSLSH